MPTEQPIVQPQEGSDRDQRIRLARAALIGLAAWWLIPRLWPFFDLETYLERIVRSMPGLVVMTPLAGFALPFVLALGAYWYPPRRPSGPDSAETQSERGAGAAWMLRLLIVMLIGGSVALAYHQRFLDDDAFISFRYARNWVEGHGLVYNPGERVEGYTNFLWTLLMAAGMKLGFEPVAFSQGLGLSCVAGTLALTWRTARLLLPGPAWAVAALVLVGSHYSVLAFAACGLETSLVTFLLAAGCSIVVAARTRSGWRQLDFLLLSGICAAGILTRMDFVVLAAVLMAVALMPARREPLGPFPMRVTSLLAPMAVVLAAWLAWKWWYYGALLPNTYYAKRAGDGAVLMGLKYLADFGRSYHYWLPGAAVLIGAIELVRRRHTAAVLLAIVLAWLAYIVAIGGDFMEFRFLVPIVPLFMILLVWTLARFRWLQHTYLAAFVLLWTLHGSLAHALTYGWTEDRAEPVSHLRWQTTGAHWAEAGRTLRELFGGSDVVIATTCAGILPYHARLKTLDMHGLTDPEVARHGCWVQNRPGHKRIADEAIMRRRGVHLVIGHPNIVRLDTLDEISLMHLENCAQGANPGTEADIMAIPISGREALLVWCLTPHAAIDAAMETHEWPVFVVTVSEQPGGG